MNNNRKTYCAPMLSVERFAANEYVAACWGVACVVATANEYEKSVNSKVWQEYYKGGTYDGYIPHDGNNCGTLSHQVIYDDNDDGTPDRMIEEQTKNLGNLTCYIFQDGSYSTIKQIADVKVGDYIYWRTYLNNNYPNGKCWSHQGKVVESYAGRPKHS